MSRLPQLLPGQPEPSWYQSPFMIAGITIAFIGVLILFLPPRYWRISWQSVLGFPSWCSKTCFWIRYGPKCSIDEPIVRSERTERGVDYIADVHFVVKNRDKHCLRVDFGLMVVVLEQKSEARPKNSLLLQTDTGIGVIELKPKDKHSCQVVVKQSCIGNPDNWPDLQSRYSWGIQNIYVMLRGRFRKELHEGKYHKIRGDQRGI